MRKLVIAIVTLELLALTACGYALAEDRELMAGLAWTRAFKAEQPDASRAIARECAEALASSANLNRDGALQLFACIRREAEKKGYA
jgi:outer membrane lipopolysaccharide assembly protein LptE/RlpB